MIDNPNYIQRDGSLNCYIPRLNIKLDAVLADLNVNESGEPRVIFV
jgi:hypothetical protein